MPMKWTPTSSLSVVPPCVPSKSATIYIMYY